MPRFSPFSPSTREVDGYERKNYCRLLGRRCSHRSRRVRNFARVSGEDLLTTPAFKYEGQDLVNRLTWERVKD